MDITAIVTNLVAHSISSAVPKFLAMSKATGAKAAYNTKKNIIVNHILLNIKIITTNENLVSILICLIICCRSVSRNV